MIKRALKRISYVLFPRRCELCGEVCEFDRVRCEECESAQRITGKICTKCGREEDRCTCKKEKFSPSYKGFAAPYYYKSSFVRGVIRFKNYGFTELAPVMADEIAKTLKQRFEGVDFDFITCVPMTDKKKRKRGYNQSELLAQELSDILNIEYKQLLEKPRDTASQRYSSVQERKVNLYGAFDVRDKESVKGKTVLIIDDVKTTGSTLAECSAMLMANGAKAVYAASLCVTDKK